MGHCLDVLYLSYSHLPSHLKPCFLYTGTYTEDTEIRASQIIRLWVAEGFLKPNGLQILEEMAEDYLNDLFDRNLILVSARGLNGRIKSFRIHDLLRELCISVANKEKFFCVVRKKSIPQGIDRDRCFIFHDQNADYGNEEVFEALQSASLARSVIVDLVHSVCIPVKCRLLRVLTKFYWGSFEIRNVNLRYFDFEFESRTLSSLSLIWNAQTLIIAPRNQEISTPLDIWKLTQLRHLKCRNWLWFPDPPLSEKEDNSFVLGNLQTLKSVHNFRLSEETCKRIPNIKRLCLIYSDKHLERYDNRLYDTLQNLGRLHKLESLNIRCFGVTTRISTKELKNAFPSSLRKLVLTGCRLNWNDLSTIVGSLHQLEVFKLEKFFSKACTWSCFEGGFRRLKFLSIDGEYLKSWTLDNPSCFPVLETLVLVRFWNLNKIPWGIEEIPTLQLIRLEDGQSLVAIWALKIKEEQESFGFYGLLLQASLDDFQEMRLREMVEIEGLSINNIHIERI